MSRRLDWRKLGAGALLALLWCVMAWEIAQLNLAAQAADARAGEAALALRPQSGRAATEVALAHYRAGNDRAAAAAARLALRHDPLEVAALRALGQSLNRQRPGAGNELMLLAGQLGWRDVPTQLWLLQQAIRVGEVPVAVQRAEAVIRVQGNTDVAYPLFRVLAMDDVGRSLVVDSLAAGPSWRSTFFIVGSGTRGPQLDGMIRIFEELARRGAPPTPAEVTPTVNALYAAERADEAYRLYRRFGLSRPSQALLPNGDFESGYSYDPQVVSLFDWSRRNAEGAVAEVQQANDGHVLYASASRGQAAPIFGRFTRLAPGSYVLRYRIRTGAEGRPDAFRFRVDCVGGQPGILTESARAEPVEQWVERVVTFAVPAGCETQSLYLIATPNPDTSVLEAEIDDVAVARTRG